ncbi:carboxymuconolactone decarboxylase family protein [Saccharopolyspora rosea]|uniref:Carboxymuconolactone decarboxylase family protein n=1 Tax=Saccharopolyspora rosea TaxID=524884 RepID=A0ABW3G2L8_9PSEU|nr:carboxymuconolactone decarboxylase family protein [Saccharopolyspora rosea]
MSETRFDLPRLTPSTFEALNQLTRQAEANARDSGVDAGLLELVRLRASQINGCGFCQSTHTRQALDEGESEQRLRALPNWPDSDLFTDRERAALRLAESITRLDGGVPDEDYLPAEQHFDEKQLVGLVWTVALINTYNRLAISMSSLN